MKSRSSESKTRGCVSDTSSKQCGYTKIISPTGDDIVHGNERSDINDESQTHHVDRRGVEDTIAASNDSRGPSMASASKSKPMNWSSKVGSYDSRRGVVPTIKKAYGIACVRYNDIARQYEILMVRKRCTYAFISFVSGRYCRNDERTIMDLLNAMTNQEKLDVLSLDFDILWWRIWLARSHEYATTHGLQLKANPADSKEWMAIYEKRTLWGLMSTEQ